MEFKEICALFGGQRQTARILGTNERNVRRWCAANKKHAWVLEKLNIHADKIKKEISKEVACA